MPRLFTGIEIPVELREELSRLRMPLPGGKWVEPADLHMTLRFVGDLDNARATEFAERLGAIDTDAFELRLSGLGTFGGHEPRSIWAGVESSPALEALAKANDRAARAVGLPPDAHPFKPHVTLARFKFSSVDAIARVLGRIGAFRSQPFLVGRFVLFSAKPKTGGGPYAVEEAFPLRGGEFADFSDSEGSW